MGAVKFGKRGEVINKNGSGEKIIENREWSDGTYVCPDI